MPRTKRKDKSRAVLRTGESQRADGTYQFRWTDSNHKRFCVYAKTLDELRYKEEQIKKDKSDGIKTEARYTMVNEVYELWKELKRGLKNNTFENYKYMYETFVRHQIGSKTVSSLKKTDIKRFYNYLTDERQLKPSTIDSIHTVLRQILDMAVDDDYIRNNPSDNVLRELKQAHCFKTEKRRALTRPEQELSHRWKQKRLLLQCQYAENSGWKEKSANAQFCERGNYNGKGKAGAARSSLYRYH